MITDNDEIKALIQTTIQTKIIQAFHDAPDAIDKLVQAAMEQNVSEHGTAPSNYSRAKFTYLEWLVGDTIRNVAREAVVNIVREREEEIKTAVARAILADDIVNGFTQKIMGTLDKEYKLTINFADETNDEN